MVQGHGFSSLYHCMPYSGSTFVLTIINLLSYKHVKKSSLTWTLKTWSALLFLTMWLLKYSSPPHKTSSTISYLLNIMGAAETGFVFYFPGLPSHKNIFNHLFPCNLITPFQWPYGYSLLRPPPVFFQSWLHLQLFRHCIIYVRASTRHWPWKWPW
jgi:hypothetical protein